MIYENNWDSLNTRPVPKWFGNAKFGIFIHWGLYSVPAYTQNGLYSEWYYKQIEQAEHPAKLFHDRVFPGKRYEDFVSGFTAELFDANAWAKLFKDSGARYINLVSKHHDGFCLYPTKYAYNWNSWDVGPHRDFCMELREAMEGTGVKFGVYHSVMEWVHPLILENPERYALEHLIPMLKEIVERYQPWTLFTDGEWTQPPEVWHSTDFLTWLYNESSVRDVIVPNDRWGKGTRGHLGGNFTTEYGTIDGTKKLDETALDRPFEECRGIGKSFGFNRIETTADYMSAKECIETLCSLVSLGGNFLLNIGPAADGTIPVIMEERLLQIGKWLKVNGDAIYDTEVYNKKADLGVYYTKKENSVYAILNHFPFGTQKLANVPYTPDLRAKLLCCADAPIQVRENDGCAELVFPALNPDDLQCEWLYAVELTTEK